MPTSDPNTRNADLALLHPVVRERVEAVLADLERAGIPFRVFEAFRSPRRQHFLFQQGRDRPGNIVTRAKAWQSYHQYGLAADFVLFENGRWNWSDTGERARWWAEMHRIGRQHDLEPLSWEKPHLQLPGTGWRTLHAGRYPEGGDDSWAHNLEAAIIGWSGSPASPPLPTRIPVRPAIQDDSATPAVDWFNPFGGQEWRVDSDGVHVRTDAGDSLLLRTPGRPITCQAIRERFGAEIAAAAAEHEVPAELLVMLIAVGAAAFRPMGFTGPTTFRWEPGHVVPDAEGRPYGDYRAGPIQFLASTAREAVRGREDVDPFSVAPHYRIQPAPPPQHPLYDADVSIGLAAALVRKHWPETGANPVLVAAAFDTGAVEPTEANPWKIRSTGDFLDRATAWYGDACATR